MRFLIALFLLIGICYAQNEEAISPNEFQITEIRIETREDLEHSQADIEREIALLQSRLDEVNRKIALLDLKAEEEEE